MTEPAPKPPGGRAKNGGARPGAGRPFEDSDKFCISLNRNVRVRLERFARSHGIERRERCRWWGIVIEKLLEGRELPEPDYLACIPKGRSPIMND